ncbi:MAG TPA: hypothetical protein VNO30_33200 [Kofleriaceae bacterium]|nr:hypothetical protein [Kofleriaceae bacterium]
MGAKTIVSAAFAAAALCAITQHADADPARAWAAAKDNLPAQTALVIGADLTAITKSQLFKMIMPMALASQPDAQKLIETIKTTCKIDPLGAVHGVVYASDADRKQGAVYLSLGAGLDQPKLTKCFEDVAKATGAKDTKLAVKKVGAVTEITHNNDKAYVSWVGSDVLVIGTDPRDKAALEKWVGQKGGVAKSPVGKLAASANTKGAIWGASSVSKELEPGMKMKSAYGALTVAGGNLTIDLHPTLDSAKAAADAVSKANGELTKLAADGSLPAGAKTMLQQISVKATGPDVTVKATIAESDLLSLLPLLMQ